ncbi:MAG: ABC transporter permease [Chloroflexota bacterium]|nr:ABC transporter permease [Chloroflexota bacterium]
MAGESLPRSATAAVSDEPSGSRNLLGALSASFTLLILLALILVFALLQGTRFLNLANAQDIALNASQLLLLTVGVTFVIITAGIDLSVGAVLVFSAVIAAKTMIWLSGTPEQIRAYEFPNQGLGIPVGLLAGVVAGTAWGLVNGVLVTRLKLPSFIVTLGTLGMALGAARLMTGGTTIPNVPPAVQQEIGLRELVGFDVGEAHVRITPPLVVTTLVVVAAAVALSRTRFGRYTYAIGSNAAAARRAGINVDRHLLKVYGLSGLLAGIAGGFDLLRFGTASVGTHDSDNLAAVSAAVIGGTSLFGGLGSIGGSVVGAFIPAVLRNGLVISRVQPFWQDVLIGAILVLAVYLDQRRRRAEERM